MNASFPSAYAPAPSACAFAPVLRSQSQSPSAVSPAIAPSSALSAVSPAIAPPVTSSAGHEGGRAHFEALDLLGRLPVPLRRPFKAGLDAAVARAPRRLLCRMLSGAEWYTPFDQLAHWPAERLPAFLVTTLHADLFAPGLLRHYTPDCASDTTSNCTSNCIPNCTSDSAPNYAPNSAPDSRPAPPSDSPLHPACAAAGLRDESGVFRPFALVPFVFLVDETRLRGRPAPRVWADLLSPIWADEIVFGGWRPNETSEWRDHCAYLLLCLYLEFGAAGVAAFAANVRHLQHNVRTATLAGSNSRQVGAIAVLPWLQAELCPRRARVRVVWPEDGALIQPISSCRLQSCGRRWASSASSAQEDVRDDAATIREKYLMAYLQSRELGAMLTRNAYPPVSLDMGAATAYPPGIRLKWPGWAYFHSGRMAADSAAASDGFFSVWYAQHGFDIARRAASCGS